MKIVNATMQDINSFSESAIKELKILKYDKVLVVGVASGGVCLAKNISSKIGPSATYHEVTCQRPSTKNKKNGPSGKLFDFIIKILPNFILDILRNVEHYFLSAKRVPDRNIKDSAELTCNDFDSILIIDDAIDSGYSLKCVVDYFAFKYDIPIYTAVYVTTQVNPVFNADFSFFKNVLVRFPWSKDA